MKYYFQHFNFNVLDLEKSMKFYEEALGLTESRRRVAEDGSFILVFLKDNCGSPFELELTWLKDRTEPYDLGEQEFHLGFVVDDFEAARKKHEEMGVICFDNQKMGIYFIEDPDGYWLEVVPTRR